MAVSLFSRRGVNGFYWNLRKKEMIPMDDLRVESYDAEEVSRKKQKILKRIALTGSVIGIVLSLFGLSVLGRTPGAIRDTPTSPDHQVVVGGWGLPGGAGSWFFSWGSWRDWPD